MFAKKSIEFLIAHLQKVVASGDATKAADMELWYRVEPTTVLTDGILALLTIFLAGYLFARAAGRRSVVLWAWGFVAMTACAFAGVIYHSMRVIYELTRVDHLWRTVPITTALSMCFLGCAAATAWLKGSVKHAVYAGLAVLFVADAIWAAKAESTSLGIAVVGSAPVLVGLLIGSVLRWHEEASRWIVAGVLATGVAVLVQKTEWITYESFDFNDLFHIIQMAAMILLYRGGILLQDREPSAASAPQPVIVPSPAG